MGWQIMGKETFIVRVTFDREKTDVWEILCGPFTDIADAEDFAQHWAVGSEHFEAAQVQYVNAVTKFADA